MTKEDADEFLLLQGKFHVGKASDSEVSRLKDLVFYLDPSDDDVIDKPFRVSFKDTLAGWKRYFGFTVSCEA